MKEREEEIALYLLNSACVPLCIFCWKYPVELQPDDTHSGCLGSHDHRTGNGSHICEIRPQSREGVMTVTQNSDSDSILNSLVLSSKFFRG